MTQPSLPADWALCTLKDLGTWRGGGTPSKAKSEYWVGGTIPWVSPKDMKTFRLTTAQDLITEDAVKNSSANVLPAHSVAIVTRSGILERTLPVAVLEVSAAVNQDLKVLTPISGVDPSFVAYFLRGHERDVLNSCMKNGTTVASVDFTRLLAFEIPIPPLDEQRQIVAEIETQFARLDDAAASLKRARVRLKRYRAAVLKAACEGRLVTTEAELARQEGREYESASALLERIRAEREAAPAKGSSKRGPTHRRPGSGQGQLALTVDGGTAPTEGGAELPEGWAWVSPLQIASDDRNALSIGPFGSNLKVSDYRDEGVPLIFVRNIRTGVFNGLGTKFVDPAKALELASHKVVAGDVLITKMGDPPGDATIYPIGSPDAIITADCIRFQIRSEAVLEPYVSIAINSEHGRQQFRRMTRGVAQQKVSLARFKEVALPLPPLSEQKRIVAEVERMTSVIDQMEATVETNLKRAESLRQSILRRAFSRRLVGAGFGMESS